MNKYCIGLIAAAIGASSAYASQAMPNYNASFDTSRIASTTSGKKGPVTLPTLRKGSVVLKNPAATPTFGTTKHYEAKLKTSTFTWASAATPKALVAPLQSSKIVESAAREYLSQSGASKLGKQTVSDARLMSTHDLGKGPIITRFQQTYNGQEVFGRQMNVLMNRDMKLVATSGYFAPVASVASGGATSSAKAGGSSAKSGDSYSIGADRAIALAFSDFSQQATSASSFSSARSVGNYAVYAPAAQQTGEIRPEGNQRAKKVYFPLDGKMVPAWYVEVAGRTQDLADQFAYGYVVSAVDGSVLFRKSQIDYDFSYNAYADATAPFQPYDSPLGNSRDPFVGTAPTGTSDFEPVPRTGATINTVTLNNGPISTNDPWLPAGATTTTGNNVDAYLDLSGTVDSAGNVTSGDGFQPNTADRRTAAVGNTFPYTYTPDADPTTNDQRNFAVVHQFYVDNWLHDWWYDNGFDEVSGNAQLSNYNRGGVEGDPLLAEGQDFSGRNNANEQTRADGTSPRQQMYLFDGQPIIAAVQGVSPAFGPYAVGTAAFGPTSFDVTGTVVTAAPLTGCSALTNAAAVAGNIVVINRGTCTFQTKAAMAQAAGAIAVIIANNAAGAPPAMAGDATQPAITIGTLSVSQDDGNALKGLIAAGPVTAREAYVPGTDSDGTLDTQVIAHEWFHTTSNRLVGDAAGLSTQQAGGMGEGWSDFDSMLLTVRPEDRLVSGNDTYQGAYPQAYYATRDLYYGIRRAPYSTDFNIFPLTFKYISNGVPLPTNAPLSSGQSGATNAEVHSVGEIWCNVLWEIYASLLNDPRYSFAQAQDRMKTYIIEGLKMTPNAPTMLEARDALLSAALATDAGDFKLMATAFAKRGFGAGAIAPDRDDATNANAIEDFTALAGRIDVVSATINTDYLRGTLNGDIDEDNVLDPSETALLTLTVMNNGTADITSPVVVNFTASDAVTFSNGPQISFAATTAAPFKIGTTRTGTIQVRLDSASSTAEALTLTLTFPDVGATPTTNFEPAPVDIVINVNYDLAPNTRAVDDLEEPLAAVKDWTTTLIGSADGWQVVDGNADPYDFGTGNIWFANESASPSDVLLATPVLNVGTGAFSIAFDHYFQFETGSDGTHFDGGVMEISSDGGTTWTDVVDAGGTFTTGGGYSGTLVSLDADGTAAPNDDAATPHAAFVGDNFDAGGGSLEHIVLSFGTTFANKSVLIRFREVTDAGGTAVGWAVDNIGFTGVNNAPVFSSVVPEDNNKPPVANAGRDVAGTVGVVTTLTGSATDDAGVTGLTYKWSQTAGPTVVINNDTSNKASFTPTAAGTYTFLLTVTDAGGLRGSDSVNVSAADAPVAPAPSPTVHKGGAFGLGLLIPGFAAMLLRRRRVKMLK